jgi:PAS domain S-box-containing protein
MKVSDEASPTRDLRDFYAALVESSDDAIVAKDTDGIVMGWNPAAEHLFGWTADEMTGQSIRRLLPADRQDEEDRILERIRGGERVGQFFTKRVHKDGHLIDVSITVSPVRDSRGVIVGASKIARDARPLLESQRRIRESEERFRTLAETISQFVWVANADGHIVWYNQRFYDYTGLSEEDLAGSLKDRVLHPDEASRVQASFRHAIESGESWEDLFRLRGSDGSYRWYLSRAKPLRAEDGTIAWWFGTNTDVTDQREKEEQIRLLMMEVNHRSKNLLSTVQALARRSVSEDRSFIARFEDRIRSLAVNQDILVQRAWREVPVAELVERQLAFLSGAPGEVRMEGPDCALVPRAAEVIGMAIHELATNSLKYGALSVEGGYVRVGWESHAGGFEITWSERGGPPVRQPDHTGFGTTLIRDVPRHNLDAKVELDYLNEGLRWSLACGPAALARPPADV